MSRVRIPPLAPKKRKEEEWKEFRLSILPRHVQGLPQIRSICGKRRMFSPVRIPPLAPKKSFIGEKAKGESLYEIY